MSAPDPAHPRLLLLSASVGAGHTRAAEAVELALKELAPRAVVQHVDVMSLTNAMFRQLYAKTYLDLICKSPFLAGVVYDFTDRAPSPDRNLDKIRVLGQRLNLSKLTSLLKDPGSRHRSSKDTLNPRSRWDMVINTHFLPAEMVARLRRKTSWAGGPPQVTVVTDFDAHGMWVNTPTDHYFAATEEAAVSLGGWGVARERVTVTGIPIHPIFSTPKSPEACRQKHGLSPDHARVVLMAGGFGVGKVELLLDALLKTIRPLHVVAVAGKNAKLKAKFERVEIPARHRVSVLGFTRDIDELMAGADVMVTKPGGLSSSETITRAGQGGAVMVIINPIPGQESRNSDYLLEHGAAVKAASPILLPWKLERLLADTDHLRMMRQRSREIARPHAAYEIARNVLKMVGHDVA